MALALQSYHDKNGHLPPAVVYGVDGKPLYSWRVLILPYIEQQQLYDEFHLDEPWDSPNNVKLLSRMPVTYAPPAGKARRVPPYHTVVHVFVGEGTAFEGKEGLCLGRDFPDGTCNTILVVEAGKAVPWSKPQDIAFEPDRPLPRPEGLFHDGFRACTADGARQWVSKRVSDETLRAHILRRRGEKEMPGW